ncbi:MAG: formylglycine-generating enzyme family protein [Myxococcales bacterium]|nr:formylglycine-generating enzyme family protein [Myxococcales bacterium]
MPRPRLAALTLALAACGWPAGLPSSAAPGAMPGGGAWPDLLAPADRPPGGGEDAAVIVAIGDYEGLPDRPGAHAAAAAWYRWFREARGLRPPRIHLLRDADATPRRISRAIEAARRGARHGALWLVVVGHIGSRDAGAYGDLRLRDGAAYSLEHAIGRVAYGRHARAVAVLDGCLADGPAAAGTATPPPPPFASPRTTRAALRSRQAREWVGPRRARREPADVAVFSSGRGPGCTADLPGTRFPALAYLALGGLRGWADRDGNHNVRALEVLRHVAVSLRAAVVDGPRPEPSLHGVDLLLARRVDEPPPPFARLRPPGAPAVSERELHAEPVLFSEDTMVALERASFTMGCPRADDRDCEPDERPPGRLRLSRLRIDRREVTQAEYRRCVDAGVCTPIDPARCFVWTGDAFVRGAAVPAGMIGPDLPAVCVTWSQAEAYCDARGKHLPTEAEWERAAAGLERRRFPWGDAPPTCARAHFDGCGEHLRPVGSHPAGATPEGVHDLAGNASEWVHDWYDARTYEHRGYWRTDPRGPLDGQVRVIRGGSYYDAATVLRAAYRYGLNPRSGFSTVGLRCAR